MALAAKNLRDKKPEELREELGRLKRESMNLRFQAATGQLNSTAEMKKARRDAARVKTILNEKARAADAAATAAQASAE